MVALVKETGAGVANANTYGDESDLTSYAAARGITISGVAEDLMIKAMDYIEQQDFLGYKVDKDQPLQFPRYEVVLERYHREKDSEAVFKILVEGQCRLAIAIDQGNDPMSPSKRVKQRVRIEGAADITYSDKGPTRTTDYSYDTILSKLYAKNSGAMFLDRA